MNDALDALDTGAASRRIAFFVGGFVLSQILAGIVLIPVVATISETGSAVGAERFLIWR